MNKSHTAPSLFILGTSILKHSHNYKYRGTQTKTAVAEGSHNGEVPFG